MTLRRLIALVLFAFLSGCAPSAPAPTATGTGAPGVTGSPNPAEPAGPILALVVAADIDDAGNPVGPSFTVPADQARITVIARIGEVPAGAQLEIAWFGLPDAWTTGEDAEVELFRHVLEVKPGDLAWSIGTNPGTLAAGSYLVRAMLAEQTQEISFDIPGKARTAGGAVGNGAAASGSVPASGDSGTVEAPAEPGDDCAGVQELVDAARAIYAQGFVDLTAQYALEGPNVADYDYSGLVRCTGGLNYTASAMQGHPSGPAESDPCKLSGGSDLPGAVVEHTLETGPLVRTTILNRVTLGDDTLAPRARVRSVPGPGTQVKAGDQIQVTALAEERRHGGPWQMGVERIQLLSLRPSQELVDSVDFTDKRGKACDEKQWEGTLEATYTVPPNPPPVIELCVVAEDWAGNGEDRGSWKCAEFPTGGTWTGRVTYAWREVPQDPNARRFDVHNFQDGQADVTLREVASPLVVDGRVVGEQIQLDETGTKVSEQARQRGTIPSHVCDGEGTGTITRPSHTSKIVRKTEAVDLTGVLGFDVPVGGPYYWIWPDRSAVDPSAFPYRCASGLPEQDHSWFLFDIGNLQPGTTLPGLDPELRVLSDDGKRMQGTWTWDEGHQSITVTWDLVRSEPGG